MRAAVVLGCLSAASVASAELVFLKTGRSMSVKAVRYDGDQAVMTLRMGGEVIFDKAAIDRVEPDEVEYPEPAPEPTPPPWPRRLLPPRRRSRRARCRRRRCRRR